MNKRIAVRMLKAASADMGVGNNFVCNSLKHNFRAMKRNAVVNAATLREYENTLNQLLTWISVQIEDNGTLESFISNKHNINWLKEDMVGMRKTWIGFMIEDVVTGEKLGKQSIDRMHFKTV